MLKKLRKKVLVAGLAIAATATPIAMPIIQPANVIAADTFTGLRNGKYYKNGELRGEPVNIANGWYEIHSAVPGKTNYVVDVNGAAFAGGPAKGNGEGNIQVWEDNNTIAQRFYIKSLGNGLYNITCGTGDHAKNIDVVCGEKGANIRQWAQNTAPAQKFRIIKNVKSNTLSFINESTGQALDIEGNDSFVNGRNIWDYPYLYGEDKGQNFTLTKVDDEVPKNPSNISNGWYKIHASYNTNYTLDVADGSAANGANMLLYWNNNTKAKYFYIENLGNGEYRIYTRTGTNTVLDVDTGSGANLIQWSKHDGANQKWRIYKFRNGIYSFVSVYNGKTIDISGGSTYSNRQNIQVYNTIITSNGLDPGEGQGWKLIKKDLGTVTFHKNIDNTTCKTRYIIEQDDQKFQGSYTSWKNPGYEIAGWSLNKNATKADYSLNSKINPSWFNKNKDKNNNVTVYAVWQKKKTVTPEEFGAKGDGKTNDTAAIQKAINFGAQNISFTKTYYIASNVYARNSVNMYGGGTIKGNKAEVHAQNVNFTNLKFTGNNGGIKYVTGQKDPQKYVYNSTVKNCTFSDIKTSAIHIHGYGSSASQWIIAPRGVKSHAGNITISNNNFSNIGEMSICGAGGDNVQILNNKFNKSGNEHITVDWVCKNFKIEGNTFSGTHGGTGAIGVDGAQGLVVNNNTFNSTGAGRASSSVGLNHELLNSPYVNDNITVTNNRFNKCKYGIAKNINTTGWYIENGKMELRTHSNKNVIKGLKYSGNTTASGVTLYGTNGA